MQFVRSLVYADGQVLLVDLAALAQKSLGWRGGELMYAGRTVGVGHAAEENTVLIPPRMRF